VTHVVADLRTAVRAVLTAALPDVTVARDHWIRTDLSHLPRAGVATPRVRIDRVDADTVDRAVDLVVVLKRTGGVDLEDLLDADSAVIEIAVLAHLATVSDDYDLSETQTTLDASGERPVGELSMLFRVVLRTDEATPEL